MALPTQEEVNLTPAVLAELEKLGVREGDTVGSGVTSFKLSPTGAMTRPVSVLSSQTGVKTVQDVMTKTNGTPTTETKPKVETPEPKKTAEDSLLQQEYESGLTEKQRIEKDFETETATTQSQFDSVARQLETNKQASINNIKSQYEVLRNRLLESNRRRENAETTLQIRGGSSRFAPGVSSAEIEGVVRQGLDALSTLNSEEQNLINQINSSFAEKQLSTVMENYDALRELRKDKDTALESLNKRIADANAAILKENQRLSDIEEQVKKDINGIMDEASKNGAPKEVREAILASSSVNDAYNAAGDWLQTGTGIVGEYLFYKRQMEASGLQPVDFNGYQTMDANRKAQIAKAASATGLDNTTLTKVQSIAGQFDNEAVVKDYNTIATQITFMDQLGQTPTDDIARIYAFAKVMDPNSVVREGEYATVQAYSTALLERYGLKAKRVWDNAGFLTTEARTFLNSTLEGRLKTQEKTYNNVASEYERRINKITGATDGKDYITDYTKGYISTGSEMLMNEDKAKTFLQDFVKTNPNLANQIASLAEKYNYSEIYDYLKNKGIIK